MSDIPDRWAAVPLGDLCLPTTQRAPLPAELIEYVDISSIDRERKCIASPTAMLGAKAPSRARKIVQEGDVLVSMTRPNLNAVAMVPPALTGQFASTGFDVLRAHVSIDPRWIYFLVQSKTFIDAMAWATQGALYPAVSSSVVRAFVVPVAPQAEQKRIADRLAALLARIDACRERLKSVLPTISAFRRSVLLAASSGRLTEDCRSLRPRGDAQAELNSWLARRTTTERKPPAEPDMRHWSGELPDGWAIASVNQFAECLDRLRVPIKRENRNAAVGLYPYYGANGEVGRIDEFIFDDELVLVTEDETFYGREKPISYRSSGKCWVNNHAHVLRAADVESNDYLSLVLMHYDVLPWLTGTTGRAKLTQQALNSLPIAVPPKAEMREVVRRVVRLMGLADRIEQRVTGAVDTTDRFSRAILAKAFRGELVPQDPADEPAQALLDRLRANPPPRAPPRKPGRRATT